MRFFPWKVISFGTFLAALRHFFYSTTSTAPKNYSPMLRLSIAEILFDLIDL
jgi:predicted branched-subunit amino acid permease